MAVLQDIRWSRQTVYAATVLHLISMNRTKSLISENRIHEEITNFVYTTNKT